MNTVGSVSGITSGELFYRASVQDERSWLNQKVGPTLLNFLNAGIDRQSILTKFEAREDELNEAEEVCLQCRKNRTKSLREKLVEANNLCKSYLSRSKLSYEDFVQTLIVLMDEFDDQAAKFALWYFSTLERERIIYKRRLGEEVTSCDSLQQHLKASLRLNIFAIHLESETDRQVLLKRLPSSHPQYIRCRRAASENLKPGFFDGAPSFNGINVLDVYKVENKPLLERFQRCAAMLEPGKVKGLFTSVPAKAVERTVVLGFGSLDHDVSGPYQKPKIVDDDGDEDDDDFKSLADKSMAKLKPKKSDIFRRAWFAFHDKGNGYAEKIVDQASIAKFPRTFSRYSTVEVDRFHVHESHRLKSHPGLDKDNKESLMAKERWEKSTDGGGPVTDEIRYLILCRVVIGKVFVTSKEYRGFPTVGKNPAFDSMYNPLQEEYLVLRPVQVLPEFVIQYTYNNDVSKVVASFESSPILPVDLSTAGMKMPNTVWDLQISSPSTSNNHNGNSTSNDKKKAQKSDHDDIVRRSVLPTPTTSGIRLARVPLDLENSDISSNVNINNGKISPKSSKDSNNLANKSASEMVDVQLLEKRLKNQATETSRREALTSWEQLRLNAARQRETILDATDNLHASYKRKATQLRHWESARLRETFSGASELESVQSMKHAIDRAEKDLMRQVARRREMEMEMNGMKKKNHRRR
jgi:hypothetical protein